MNFPAGVTEADALKHLSTRVDANLAQVLQEAGVPVALQYNLTVQFKLCGGSVHTRTAGRG